MATTYSSPVCMPCASHQADPSASFFRTGRALDSCRTLSRSTGSVLSMDGKRRRTKLGSISCSLANGPEVVTACSWNELVLSSDMPVLVEFWASWCGPCKMVGRLMDELAHEYSGKIRCFRIDADDYPRVAALYGVERIPTILVFKHAEKLEAIIGTLPKSVYVAAIQKSLSQ